MLTMSSPEPSEQTTNTGDVQQNNSILKPLHIQRVPPIAQEPAGLIPQRPKGGWTYTKVPGSMWTAFELDYMNLNLPLYRARKGIDRENLVRWVKSEIHTKWGTRYNNAARANPKVNKEWRKRKKVNVSH